MPGQRLAEVNCSRIQFQPGERLLVRVWCDMSAAEQAKLKKTIMQWVDQSDVKILIIDARKVDLQIDRPETGFSYSTE